MVQTLAHATRSDIYHQQDFKMCLVGVCLWSLHYEDWPLFPEPFMRPLHTDVGSCDREGVLRRIVTKTRQAYLPPAPVASGALCEL